MKRILLALKDKHASEQLEGLLADSGHKVFVASSHDNALGMYAEEKHDLVVADLNLDGGGGDNLCIHIKTGPAADSTFVILACGAATGELKKCGRSGADSYATVPVDPVDLTRRINTILKKTNWRAPRVLVKMKVDSSLGSKEFYGTTMNISTTGMLLETDKSLAREDLIFCAFYLPDQERITTRCRVVRVGKARGGRHEYGTEFLELDDGQQAELEEFIHRERETGNII